MSDLDDAISFAENEGLYDRLQEEAHRLRRELGLDTIQIFATVMKGTDTLTMASGSGNWLARTGQVREWMVHEEGKVFRGE